MRKRMLALLLCISMLLPLFEASLPAAYAEETIPVETTAPTEAPTEVPTEVPTEAPTEAPIAVASEDYSADVGKYARLNSYYSDSVVFVHDGSNAFAMTDALVYDYADFEEGLIFRITDWYFDQINSAIWYQVEAYQGNLPEDMPAGYWIFQNYTIDGYEENTLLFVTIEEPEETCPICGQVGCAAPHFYCDICKAYDCGRDHLYCNLCEKYDCTENHIWCGTCGAFDCGETHEDSYTPAQTPLIPENPTLTEGAAVSIADENGEAVTSDGLVLHAGRKLSLSAWTELEGEVSYRWQICYDMENDLWVNIQGQTGKGILISPAMFLPLLQEQGEAALRCVAFCGEETKISDPIPVRMARQDVSYTLSGSSGSGTDAQAEGDGETLTKAYVVVQYVYADGRTAAATATAEIVPGAAYSHTYDLPDVPGYKATVKDASDFDEDEREVTIAGDELQVDFAAGRLQEEYTLIVVEYVADYVSYTVIHFWQNVDNDKYTEHEREVISNTHKTGEVVKDVEKQYPGFYNLLYETPAAAADGSTVIEVYYDRFYYLMKFNLGDMGYGVDPIYDRFGAPIEVGTPTRAGYTFQGWSLDGTNKADIPATMPHESRTYIALWKVHDTAKVNVVIWGENPDDNGFSYQKTIQIDAKPGTTISGDSLIFGCGQIAHTHGDECYGCNTPAHTHDEECYTCNAESHNHTTSCYNGVGTKQGSKPNYAPNNPEEGEVYQRYSVSTKYIYIDGSWYTYSGNTSSGQNAPTTCGKTESTHIHTDACLGCGMTPHDHNNCVLLCDKAEHTHTSCRVVMEMMDTDLWYFYESETVTVEADGSTVLNVKFKRKEFTLTFTRNNSIVKTITQKWGADIRSYFPIVDQTNGTVYSKYWWKVPNGSTTLAAGKYIASLDTMPPENLTLTSYSTSNPMYIYYYVEAASWETGDDEHPIIDSPYDDGKRFVLHKLVETGKMSSLTYLEEFHNIDGYTQYKSNPTFSSFDENGSVTAQTNNYLYYSRKSFDLTFNDGYNNVRTESVPYKDNLGQYSFRPTLPSAYEAGSREFAGWYTNKECSGEQYVLSNHIMPAENLILYAKWEPIEYKVNYYLSRDSLDRGENIPAEIIRLVNEAVAAGATRPATDPYTTTFEEDIVKHGAYIGFPGDPKVSEGYEDIHPKAGLEFIGWFYLDEDGEEAAFDPENMPVTQDLNLYAKWNSKVLCKYNVYFVLAATDAEGNLLLKDGKPYPATDAEGNLIYVADPNTGSGIAGRTYTFPAKGGSDLYTGYQEGYFPISGENVIAGSHSITIDAKDPEGTAENSFTFLYRERPAVPYRVRYINTATGTSVFDGKTVPDKYVEENKNVVVTENFVPINKYMPDEYQKTLVVTEGGTNVITFYYTKDEQHALYVVNHYVEMLNEKLEHVGWKLDTFLQNPPGNIGKVYDADAISIDGFTLSKTYTDGFNRGLAPIATKPINGMTGADLPSQPITALADGIIQGTLGENGMELNFYYTRNLYPYEFRFMLNGTTTELADRVVGKAGFDMVVNQASKDIVMDLDGDGIYEDYQLYDATETSKDIRIKVDGEKLEPDAVVQPGDATVNIATFYYVRCTQTMTITKEVKGDGADLTQDFAFSLMINAKDGYHRTSYAYEKSNGEKGNLSYSVANNKMLNFTLKHGETITIQGLPTAEYTLTELNVPLGYYDSYAPAQKYKLTVDDEVNVTVTNTYDPANLEITKTVGVAEAGNIPEVEEFEFTITVPDGVTGTFSYTLITEDDDGEAVTTEETVEVDEDGHMVIELKRNQTARFENLPLGKYTIEEKDYSAEGYKSSYTVNGLVPLSLNPSVEVEMVRGETQRIECINNFPVGDLIIEKIISKEFYKTQFPDGNMEFTFTIQRTTADKPLKVGNSYGVYAGSSEIGTATVNDAGDLEVTIAFTLTAEEQAVLNDKDQPDATVTRTVTVKNLPAGTYSVTEKEDAAYHQSASGYSRTGEEKTDATAEGLTVSGLTIPANEIKAIFSNRLKRTTGDLSLKKLLIKEEGFLGDLPTDTVFQFTFELTEQPPAGTKEISYVLTDAENQEEIKTTQMTDGKFTIEIMMDQLVSFTGLPIGTYKITETSIPHYANSFDGDVTSSEIVNGILIAQVEVETGDPKEVQCTNVYPVNLADLTIIRNNAEADQVFVYQVTDGKDLTITVTVTGNGSTTIHDLPLGEYTVTQLNGWSWRYEDGSKTVELGSNGEEVEFGGKATKDQWLNGNSEPVKNIHGGGSR